MKHLKTLLVATILIISMSVNAEILPDTLVKPVLEKSQYKIITSNADNGCDISPIRGEWIGYKTYIMVTLTGSGSKMVFYLTHHEGDMYFIRDSKFDEIDNSLVIYTQDQSYVYLMGFGYKERYKVKDIYK